MDKSNNIPREIERKYLIKRPDVETLNSLPEGRFSEITQTYLTDGENGSCRRVRKRGTKSEGYKYYFTEKRQLGFGERFEFEQEIDEKQYNVLLEQADSHRKTIEKIRWCFVYEGQLFELDIYDFSQTLATLEIELDDINTPVKFPDFIELVRDVTAEKRYSNASLAYSLSLTE